MDFFGFFGFFGFVGFVGFLGFLGFPGFLGILGFFFTGSRPSQNVNCRPGPTEILLKSLFSNSPFQALLRLAILRTINKIVVLWYLISCTVCKSHAHSSFQLLSLSLKQALLSYQIVFLSLFNILLLEPSHLVVCVSRGDKSYQWMHFFFSVKLLGSGPL